MRLNRYLASCGLGSRRTCDVLIGEQRVRVNGRLAQLGLRVEAGDVVEVDGRPVEPIGRRHVWMLNKPRGVLTSMKDVRGRTTVEDLVRKRAGDLRLFPVGRLDFDTTGLLLLTNDGELSFRLTHPSQKIEKEYHAIVAARLASGSIAKLQSGLLLDDRKTSPCRVQQHPEAGRTRVQLVLHEGRKRQVRRMLQAVGHPVLALRRVRIGPLELQDLAVGDLRPLTGAELRALDECMGLEPKADLGHTE